MMPTGRVLYRRFGSRAAPQLLADPFAATVQMSDVPTLYDWAGGTVAFRRLIDAFYDRVESDDLLSVLFLGGVSEEHRVNVVLWWAEVMGGPADYTERLGGYPRMLSHDRDLRITAEQRFRFASTMSRAADDAELRTIRSTVPPSSGTSSGAPASPCSSPCSPNR